MTDHALLFDAACSSSCRHIILGKIWYLWADTCNRTHLVLVSHDRTKCVKCFSMEVFYASLYEDIRTLSHHMFHLPHTDISSALNDQTHKNSCRLRCGKKCYDLLWARILFELKWNYMEQSHFDGKFQMPC